MALQELSTNVINTMVKKLSTRRVGLRIALLLCVALLGVQTTRAQHAFEFSARVGANALLYTSDYGKFMPNGNLGVDFSYKYRSSYYVGWRVGLGVEVAGSTFLGVNPGNPAYSYADSYIMPRVEEPDNMLVNVNYQIGRFTETQAMLIASVPLQLGLYFGNFSMFLGVRAEYPIMGYYWQRIKNANLSLYFPDTDVPVNANDGDIDPSTGEPLTPEGRSAAYFAAGPRANERVEFRKLQRSSMRLWYLNPIIDLNYSFKVGDNTDFAIGIYAEFDPWGHKPTAYHNTLLQWNIHEPDMSDPSSTASMDYSFSRGYNSVLETNRADGMSVYLKQTDQDYSQGNAIVKKFNRAAVGIRLSVSLWSVPLDDGNIFRKQGKFRKQCLCDMLTN